MTREIGRRLREIRSWHDLNLRTVAELSAIPLDHLLQIERGEESVTRRSTVEALARALRASPGELAGKPYAPVDPVSSEAHAGLAAVETALAVHDLGTDPEVAVRPWPELAAAVAHLNEVLLADADYAALGAVLPGLLAELHATYVRVPAHRRDALVALVHAYYSATVFCKVLGVRGLPVLAAWLGQRCAEQLDTPEWTGFAAFVRGYAGGPLNRPHQYTRSVRAADQLQGSLADPNTLQVTGMLHLNAALACAAQGDAERTRDHLAEAADLAGRLPERRENFGHLYFGPDNVGIWRVSLGTEIAEGAKVAELATGVHPEAIPSKARQATFYADLGRALASERPTRERGVQALARAESIAPQWTWHSVFVREIVADLLTRVNPDSTAGGELRGMAYRMGLAPVG